MFSAEIKREVIENHRIELIKTRYHTDHVHTARMVQQTLPAQPTIVPAVQTVARINHHPTRLRVVL